MGKTASMPRGDWLAQDSAGLIVAIALHAAVIAAFILFQPGPQRIVDNPPSISVSLANDVSLEATAPDPVPESRAAIAPRLSDTPAPVAATPLDPTQPSRPVPEPRPQPAPPRSASPARTAPSAPSLPRTASRERSPPAREATPSAAAQGGGSAIGEDFLEGLGGSRESANTGAPAARFGPSEQAALSSAINRQLRPHWRGKAPSGSDAEKLVTVLAFRLNKDGSLAGRPRVVRQTGVTPSNDPQKDRHAEVAIRAVQLAAPFNLPEQFYSKWDDLEWQFDRRL